MQDKAVCFHEGFKAAAAFAFIVLVFVTGCSAPPYRTPGAETAPLSTLAVVKSAPRAVTYFVSVDGQKSPHLLQPLDRWELTPGEHAVVVGLRTHPQLRAETVPMRFVALPGQTYVIQYEVKSSWGRSTWHAWIETEGGATVSFDDPGRPRSLSN
jgi:hypothetical protein